MKAYALIMAGGGGTRLWPLSVKSTPKQVLKVAGKDTMLNETICRLETSIKKENIFIITNTSQSEIIKRTLVEGVPYSNVIAEPAARNTAPCILLGAFLFERLFGECIMAVLPADHYIKDTAKFGEVLNKAVDTAKKHDKLVTLGITPTYAATGYGYIEVGGKYEENVYSVKKFVEKPDNKTAEKYFSSGLYLWNSGMFVWKTSVIKDSFKKHMPDMFGAVDEIFKHYGGRDFDNKLDEIYPKLENISIDYAILEKSEDVLVVPGDFGWNDIGSIRALDDICEKDKDNNVVKGDFFGIDTKNCIIYSENKLVSTIGLDGYIVVATDDAVLICPKENDQDIKKIVNSLKENKKFEKYL